MDASVAVPDACRANLFDPSFETGLLAATRFVMIGGPIEFQARDDFVLHVEEIGERLNEPFGPEMIARAGGPVAAA